MQDVGHAPAWLDPPSLVAQLIRAAAAKAPGQVRKLEGPQTLCSGGTDFRLALKRGQAEESQQEGQGGSTGRTGGKTHNVSPASPHGQLGKEAHPEGQAPPGPPNAIFWVSV